MKAFPTLDTGAGERVRPHGRCEVCGRVVQTLRDGTNRRHKPPGHHGWEADSCPGSGYRQARWPVGQRLRHHAGSIWLVVEDRCGTTCWRDYLLRCVYRGAWGAREPNAMVVHGEYMHRHGWTPVDDEDRG